MEGKRTKRVANSDVARSAVNVPNYPIEGHGAVLYTPDGHGSGYLPKRVREIFYTLKALGSVPTIYSYATPIAFWDAVHGEWIIPAVSYSTTTAKHQSYLYELHGISIPGDCGSGDEYHAFASRRSVYDRWHNTVKAA